MTLLAFAVAVLLIVAMLAASYLLTPLSRDPKSPVQIVVIRRGLTDIQIGTLLQRRGLIRRATGFALAARIEGIKGKMVAGTYEFNASMSPRAIAWAIALGRTADDMVTIPEGFTVRQVAKRLAARHMANQQAFLLVALHQGSTFRVGGFVPPPSLEGYLFPDTYRIPAGTSERGIVQIMLDDFHTRVFALDGRYLATHPAKIVPTVKMASLVEREAEVDGDRPKIAAALENRLRIGMKLDCDATIEYALPEHKKRLYYKDLKLDTPYNSYLHAGLPPTPIANPGLPSILASLRPARAGYLYYVARPDGSHIFSDTLAQHDHAIRLIRHLSGQGPSKG